MCGYSTTKRRDLVIHFQMKHLYASKKMAIESDLNYKCDLCGYETTSFQSISGKLDSMELDHIVGIFSQSRGHSKDRLEMNVPL